MSYFLDPKKCLYFSATVSVSFHFFLPALCLQACSLHKHIYFCPANRLINTIFLRLHIYVLIYHIWFFSFTVSQSVSSVAQSCPSLCDPMNRSTPGLPVHHQLLEPTQTHVHRVSDAIQPSHPLSSPSPPTFNLSQHQGLFK